MPLSKVQIAIGTAGLTAVAFASYTGYQHYRYEKAEQQTATAIQQVDQLLNENTQEISHTWGILGTALQAAGISEDAVAKIAQQISDGNDAISAATSLQAAGQARNSFAAKGDLLDAASSLQSLGMNLIKQSEDEMAAEGVAQSAAFTVGSKAYAGLDLLDKAAETAALMIYRNQLLETRAKLESDQYTLQLRVGSEQAAQMARSLLDAQALYLRNHGIDPKAHLAGMLNKMPNAEGIFQIAAAYQIVDPSQSTWNPNVIPGINPDFIAAMQCDRYVASSALSDLRWLKFTCAHYPDGNFIPAFGPCLGIDIPNPFTGGMIASSTGACSAASMHAGQSSSPAATSSAAQTSEVPSQSSNHTTQPDMGQFHVVGKDSRPYSGMFSIGDVQDRFGTRYYAAGNPQQSYKWFTGTYSIRVNGCPGKDQLAIRTGEITSVQLGFLRLPNDHDLYFVYPSTDPNETNNPCWHIDPEQQTLDENDLVAELLPGTYIVRRLRFHSHQAEGQRMVEVVAGQITVVHF